MKIAKYNLWRKQYPYYKVQWYDARSMVWRDIQQRHLTEADARRASKMLNARTRVMKVISKGKRQPI